MVTSAQCLPERILFNYQFHVLNLRRLNRTIYGSVIVTSEMVAKTIKAMKDNKSQGVGGIIPKLLMETVVSIPQAREFNLSLKL